MDLFTLLLLMLLVGWILWFFKSGTGKSVGRFLPAPFWVYFLSILLGTVGILPRTSGIYSLVLIHVLPASLILLLMGTPLGSLISLGPRAMGAVFLAMGCMFVGTIISFMFIGPFLPSEAWKMAGTMLGTWTGGSANMVAVKEVLGLSDQGIGPLILADTFFSYGWLALLLFGVVWEKKFNSGLKIKPLDVSAGADQNPLKNPKNLDRFLQVLFLLMLAFGIGEVLVYGGVVTFKITEVLSSKAWTILWASTAGLILAATPARRMESWGTADVGTFLLYVVLASMGATTSLGTALDAPWVLVYCGSVILIHGALLLVLGRLFKIPLFLLATGSQANVGGPVSAPIVAGVYRPGSAHLGVLMALVGAILGTYVGTLGGLLCRSLQYWG